MKSIFYQKIIERLDLDLEKLKQNNLSIFSHIEKAFALCNNTYHELRANVLKFGFKDVSEEVQFFRSIKPIIYSKLIFYRKLAGIESHRPLYTHDKQITFLEDEIESIHEFYKKFDDFYEYYKSGRTFNDELYFTRNRTILFLRNRNADYLTDPEFSTIHDKTVATIMAYSNLEKYLNNEIHKLKYPNGKFIEVEDSAREKMKENWTGTQYEYVELLYALRASGVINHGKSGLKELHRIFSKILNLPETDIYGPFQDIKGRKKNKTIFIDKLRDILIQRIDESDEFNPKN